MKKILRFLLVVCVVVSILSLAYFILWMFWRILSDFSAQVFLVVLMGAAFLSLMLLIPSITLLLALRKPTYEGTEGGTIGMVGLGVLMPAFLLPLLILNGGSGGFSGLMMFLFLSGAAWMVFYYIAVDWLREKRER